jgi:putative membrane protein
MKLVSTVLVFSLAVLGLAACGSTAVNVNSTANAGRNAANGASNTAGSAANTLGNMANSAANTISNAASAMTVDSPDDFMTTAARDGLAEVELGKLAAQKATDPEVKKFAQMMVDEHTKANNELKTLAGQKNVTLPTDLGNHQSDLDELKNASGADFDRGYVKLMVNAHEKDVEAFQAQADKSADPEVKAFAAKTLPTLKKHLESIQTISGRILK